MGFYINTVKKDFEELKSNITLAYNGIFEMQKLLRQYSEELLCTCENMMLDPKRKKEFKALAKVFKLNLAINRCPVLKKSFHQIQSDFARWKRISEKVNA